MKNKFVFPIGISLFVLSATAAFFLIIDWLAHGNDLTLAMWWEDTLSVFMLYAFILLLGGIGWLGSFILTKIMGVK